MNKLILRQEEQKKNSLYFQTRIHNKKHEWHDISGHRIYVKMHVFPSKSNFFLEYILLRI